MEYADEANLTERSTSVYVGIQVFQSFWSTTILRNLFLLLLLFFFFCFFYPHLFLLLSFFAFFHP